MEGTLRSFASTPPATNRACCQVKALSLLLHTQDWLTYEDHWILGFCAIVLLSPPFCLQSSSRLMIRQLFTRRSLGDTAPFLFHIYAMTVLDWSHKNRGQQFAVWLPFFSLVLGDYNTWICSAQFIHLCCFIYVYYPQYLISPSIQVFLSRFSASIVW
jgi:hypothetical protein